MTSKYFAGVDSKEIPQSDITLLYVKLRMTGPAVH
jgi:hypothetical protein